MEPKKYFLMVYNPETKEALYPREIFEDTKVVDEVEGYPYKDELYHLYNNDRYQLDAQVKGNPWRSYHEAEPFDWANMVDGVVVTASAKQAIEEAAKKSAEATE